MREANGWASGKGKSNRRERENQLHGIMIRGMTFQQVRHTDVSLRGKPKSRLHGEGDQKLNHKEELVDLSNFQLIT